MANFPGVTISDRFAKAITPPIAANLSVSRAYVGTLPLARGLSIAPGSRSAAAPVAVASWDNAGVRRELFGGELFEKVIISPRSKSLGFVISTSQFQVDVWNTFRNLPQTLQSIAIAGSGDVAIADPYGVPKTFFPYQARPYTVTIPSAGSAQILQTILFSFASGILGTDLVITGSRITLFSLAPNWSSGIREKISYLTEVLTSYSDAEQRRSLRALPRRGLAYSIVTVEPRSAAVLDALLWGWQHQAYGVPFWQDAQNLTADIAIGSTTIPVATADRLFVAGGLACLWADPFTFEALTVSSVTPTSITVTSPTQRSWTAGAKTLVVPVFLCRLADTVEFSRLFSGGDEIELDFDGEGGQASPSSGAIALTQYQGFDVLEVAPNWRDSLSRKYSRSLIVLDGKTGVKTVTDKGGSPIVGTSLPWFIGDHSKVTPFRAFLDARSGRLSPFWAPTWDQDLLLASDVLATDTGIRIQAVTYTRFFFPNKSRRNLALMSADGATKIYRKVTASVDNGDGTETLTFDAPVGAAFSKSSTMISFLSLVRLESDDLEINWSSSDLAEAVISTLEVPREVP